MKISSSKELGLLVRDRRKSKGWTQAELAQRAGVKPLWISQFERGKPTAQVNLVLNTLKALSVDLWTSTPPSKASSHEKKRIDLDELLSS